MGKPRWSLVGEGWAKFCGGIPRVAAGQQGHGPGGAAVLAKRGEFGVTAGQMHAHRSEAKKVGVVLIVRRRREGDVDGRNEGGNAGAGPDGFYTGRVRRSGGGGWKPVYEVIREASIAVFCTDRATY